MSFSAGIKEKLIADVDGCEFCAIAKLAGIMRYAGQMEPDRAVLSTENKAIADCAAELLKNCLGIQMEYEYNMQTKLYRGTIDGESAQIVYAELLAEESAESLTPFSCCRHAFIAGAFLGGGSVSDPKKSYHLEFDAKRSEYADDVVNALEKEGIAAKLTERKGRYVVYVKDYESIAAVLGIIGAGYAALELYNVSVEKEIRNDVNRRVNCENANLAKQARTASKQLHAITKIEKTVGLSKLPEVLREIAEIRRQYPEESLKELGERLNPPIGKSGVNHRLNRIVEFAENL